MRLIVIGDLHCGIYRRFPETSPDGVNLRLLDIVNELDRICQLCVKHKIETVVFLGDVFDQRNTLDVVVLNAIYKAFRSFKDSGIRLVLLVGNHDRCDVGREHSLECFKSFCDVVDVPTVLPVGDRCVVAVPFHPNPSAVVRAINQLVTSDTKLLLLHATIKGTLLPNGTSLGDGIPLAAIPEHVVCLAGDIHLHQQVRERVYYVGSLLQKDRGDSGQEKFFAFHDTATGILRWQRTFGPKFVSTDVLFLPNVENRDGLYSQEEFCAVHQECVQGNFVTVTKLPPDCFDVGLVERSLIGLGARHVEMALTTQLPMEPPRLLEPNTPIVVTTQVIKEYVDEAQTDLDKEALFEEGVAIVEQVSGLDDIDDEVTVEIN